VLPSSAGPVKILAERYERRISSLNPSGTNGVALVIDSASRSDSDNSITASRRSSAQNPATRRAINPVPQSTHSSSGLSLTSLLGNSPPAKEKSLNHSAVQHLSAPDQYLNAKSPINDPEGIDDIPSIPISKADKKPKKLVEIEHPEDQDNASLRNGFRKALEHLERLIEKMNDVDNDA
jgi:hypothetical protein